MFIEIHRRDPWRERRRGREGQWREAIGVGIKGFGAGRFAFSIWRMLPPPSRISGPCKPREKPLLPAWYRLIYSRKVAIVDIKPATPTFIPVNAIRVRVLNGEWCRLTHFIHHLTFVISIPPPTLISSLAWIARMYRPYYVRRMNNLLVLRNYRSVEIENFLKRRLIDSKDSPMQCWNYVEQRPLLG